jgi:4-carboxymuconolactone decarboxylase
VIQWGIGKQAWRSDLRRISLNRRPTYKRALDKFGERGIIDIIDLIAVSGYYVLVSMTLNVDRSPLPGDAKPSLKPLSR